MPLYLYLAEASFMHGLHPVTKVLAVAALFVCAYLPEHPAMLLPLAALVGALIVLSRSRANVRRLRFLFVLVPVFTFVIWSVFYDRGAPLLSLGPVRVTDEGAQFALGMALKLSTFLATGVLFLSTTKVEEFAFALGKLGVPYRLGFALTLAFRLVPLFLDSALTVVEARRCRGLDSEAGGAVRRLRRYVPVLVPVFIAALRKAQQMAVTLEARGFSSGLRRTSFFEPRRRAGDHIAAAAVACLLAAYVLAWTLGYGRVGGASG